MCIRDSHRALLEERPDIDLFDPGDFSVIFDSRFKWRHATVDRLYGPKGCFEGLGQTDKDTLKALKVAEGVAEFKTVSGWMKESWSSEPSAYALIQTHHQMLVTGLHKAIVAAWFGLGEDFKVYQFDANKALLDGVDRAETAFQAALESDTPPDPDESERTSKALAALYPRETLDLIPLDADALEWYQVMQKAKERRNDQNAKIREAENWLKAMIGEHEGGVLPDGGKILWTTVERGGYEVKPTSYRKLSIKKPKTEAN